MTIPSDPVVAFAGAKAQLGKESARFGQDTGSDLLTYTGGREIGGVVFDDAFPWNLANPAVNATGLTRTDSHTFAGDLLIPDTSAKKADTHAKVGVDLDTRGRFAKVTLNVDPKEKPVIFSFSDYGLKADVKAPPSGEVRYDEDSTILNETGLY